MWGKYYAKHAHKITHTCLISAPVSVCAVMSQTVVTVAPRAATVRQGESVSFRCQVGGGAVESVEWRRTNNQAMKGQGCTSCINLETSI